MSVNTAAATPDVLRLLGHDIRWQLLKLLARSDHRVIELVDKLGERQNLVSYHLTLLKRAGLVVERRSSADARDVYYHLDLSNVKAALNRSTTALHPSLHTGHDKDKPVDWRARGPRVRVLFVCTGNSARSQLAEVIMRRQAARTVEVHSAGPRPAGVHPLALEVLSELGLSTRGLRSKGLEDLADIEFDHVITLCDIAREECPQLPGAPEQTHWSLADPAGITGLRRQRREAFSRTAAELSVRISNALPFLLERKVAGAA